MKYGFIITMLLCIAFCITCICPKSYAQDSAHVNKKNKIHTPVRDTSCKECTYIETRSGFTFDGTLYTALPYATDDNPAGFTQTYLKADFSRLLKDSIAFHTQRNIFVEVLYSANVTNLPDFRDSAKAPVTYVNRLDLFEHANDMIKWHENVLFYEKAKQHSTWHTQVFIDLMQAYMRTHVTDSITGSTINVDSWLLGTNATLFVTNNSAKLPLRLRLATEIFWINPLTNYVNPDLNFQYANKSEATSAINNAKSMTANPYPYYHIDAQFQFKLNKCKCDTCKCEKPENKEKKPTNDKFVFLHIGYFTNFVGANASRYSNNYLTAQIGASIELFKSDK